MNILGIDLETSGLDPKKDRILEIGAVLWDWEAQVPLQVVSALIDPAMDGGPQAEFEVSEEIEEITGINTEMISLYGEAEGDVLFRLGQMQIHFAYFMGHNCNQFDKLFFDAACSRQGGAMFPQLVFPQSWLDSTVDIKFPPQIKTRNLRHLAAEHGFLNPLAHRAVFDVLTMFKVASNYRIEDIIARANEPTVFVQAHVSYQENQKAKDFSFRWNPTQKIWWKEYKLSDFNEEKDKYDFNTTYLADKPVEV